MSRGFEFTIEARDVPRIIGAKVTLVIGDNVSGAAYEKYLDPPRWAWEIERITDHHVSGWAVDLVCPELPALLLLKSHDDVLSFPVGDPRSDTELAPGLFARDFVIRLKDKKIRDHFPTRTRDDVWLELCVGDTLRPIANLHLLRELGRPASVGAMAGRRSVDLRSALLALEKSEAKYTNIQTASLARLAHGFEPAARAWSLMNAGIRRLPGSQGGRGIPPVVWRTGEATAKTEPFVIVCAEALSVSPLLASHVKRIATGPGDVADAWWAPDGLHGLPNNGAENENAGADWGAVDGYPFMKPRLTPRVLDQAPSYAPMLITRERNLDGWAPDDGIPALTQRLLARYGAPEPTREMLYAQTSPPPMNPEPTSPSALRRPQLVSLIVPTRDNVGHLAKLLAGVARLRRRAENVEVVIVDNRGQSDTTSAFFEWAACSWIRVVSDQGEFNFSRLSNEGARHAKGSVLLFCNDDIEIGSDFDLDGMTSLLEDPKVGVVGHTLVYEDGTIQHAGVVVGAYDAADNGQTAFHAADGGYFGLARLTREVSAVTAAFMAMRRSVFNDLNGFNEHDFGVNFNDVDLCLRAVRTGLTVLNTCRGTVIHHESVSRSLTPDRQRRELVEVAALRRIWRTDSFVDPYYGSNFQRFALPYTRPRWHRIGIDPSVVWPSIAAPR